jgi:GTPase SAR1 family protein
MPQISLLTPDVALVFEQNSFEQVQDYWVQELQHQCFGSGGLQVRSEPSTCAHVRPLTIDPTATQMAIVGNKCDLVDKRVSGCA